MGGPARLGARTACVVALLLGLAAPAAAQFGPGTRALGTAGAFVGLARGFEAIYWNPANLALPDGPGFSLGLVQPGAVAGSVGPDLFDFGILADSDPSAAEQADFLDAIPAAGAELRADVTAPWVSASIGPFGVGVATTVLAKGDVSRELVELYFDAADDGQLNGARLGSYRVGDTGYRDAAYTELTVGYGRSVDIGPIPVTAGVGVRGVRGHRLERGQLFEPSIQGQDLLISGFGLRSTGGTGIGVDVGATARPIPGLTVGVAIENLFQRMSWDEDVELLGGEFTSRELDEEGLDGVIDRFEARPFDPDAAPLEAYEIADDLLIEAYFPTVLRLGAGYRLGGTGLGATLSTTVGGGDLHAGWPRYLAVGVEQSLLVVDLRAGLASSLDGASAITLGAGLGLGVLDFSIGAARTFGSDAVRDLDDDLEGRGFGDRLAAGSGYAIKLGLSVVRP